MRILSAADVVQALPMADCVDVMASALRDNTVELPLRRAFEPAGADGRLSVWMPVYRGGGEPRFATKLLCLVPDNPSRGMDTHQGVTVLFNGVTGAPEAVLDASAVTSIRTAAVSALATRVLANPDASTLAILGAGVQAEAHLRAIPLVRSISAARVYSPRSAKALVDRVDVPFPLTVAGSAEEAVRDADIIVTATTSRVPVIECAWLKPGAHINAVGASTPDARELDDATVTSAEVFTDSMESVEHESGDVRPHHVRAVLGDVLAGRAAGRTSAGSLTLFRSLGIATEDMFAAEFAVRRATELGLGIEAPI
jgi:ornithine cyclodeaminase/alanine dehydrogenase-like protein (mu-crystallin family)